jgi:hypothetical protein
MVRKKNSGLISTFSLDPSAIFIIGDAIRAVANARRFNRPTKRSATCLALSKSNGLLWLEKNES